MVQGRQGLKEGNKDDISKIRKMHFRKKTIARFDSLILSVKVWFPQVIDNMEASIIIYL